MLGLFIASGIEWLGLITILNSADVTVVKKWFATLFYKNDLMEKLNTAQ